jgi:hypothetical protein
MEMLKTYTHPWPGDHGLGRGLIETMLTSERDRIAQ